MAILNFYMQNYEDETAPPSDDVLKVSLSGDVVFLEIGAYTETFDVASFKTNEGGRIGVPVRDFLPMLQAYADAEEDAKWKGSS